VQPPTTFEFIINLKTAKCPQTNLPASLLARPDAVIECERHLLRCMSLLLAPFGHGVMSELSPLSGVKLKLDFGAVRAAFDPGCVKTLCGCYDCLVILRGY
jgi:hypothetical protein